MDMSLDHPTPVRRFLRTWRRELIRGGVLFTLVLCTGLFIRSIKVRMPSPLGALGAFGDFNWGDGDGGDLFGRGREVGDAWHYATVLTTTQHVWIRNTNGPIDVNTSSGPVEATTVNGSIDANMEKLTGGDVRLTTVNGSVTAGLPRTINADIDAETVNGRVETDFPIKVSGKMSTRHLRGTIGKSVSTRP